MVAGTQSCIIKSEPGSLYPKITGSVYLTAKLKRTIVVNGAYGFYYRSQAVEIYVYMICTKGVCVANINMCLKNMTIHTVTKFQQLEIDKVC